MSKSIATAAASEAASERTSDSETQITLNWRSCNNTTGNKAWQFGLCARRWLPVIGGYENMISSNDCWYFISDRAMRVMDSLLFNEIQVCRIYYGNIGLFFMLRYIGVMNACRTFSRGRGKTACTDIAQRRERNFVTFNVLYSIWWHLMRAQKTQAKPLEHFAQKSL